MEDPMLTRTRHAQMRGLGGRLAIRGPDHVLQYLVVYPILGHFGVLLSTVKILVLRQLN